MADFVSRATTIPIPELPSHIKTFPRAWPFPRGDLYHWINVLNRIDDILATVIGKYDLNNGPQTKPFARLVLVESYTNDESKATSGEDIDTRLNALGFGPDGDRELVEVILNFSKLLLEKCGNRSLYSSSERLGDLLNTTSLSLLQTTLRLALSLAQRYHSRHRGSHIQPSLLAAHYNIDLEKLLKIAVPFPRPFTSGKPSAASPAPSSKGKEKGIQTKHNANDFISLTRENDGWDEWGHVHLLYYPPGTSEQPKPTADSGQAPQAPSTPTPLRRSHTNPTPRLNNRSTVVEDSPGSATNNSPAGKPEEPTQSGKILDIPNSKVSSSSTENILTSHLNEVPPESKYELLHKIRIAQSLATSNDSREQILAIRLLAITNLAFVYPEALFQQKVLLCDMEQPKRLQLAYQTAELVHLSASGDLPVARNVQAYAILALDALARHKARSMDVCAALSINVNHGILMFLTRKAVNELGSEDNDQEDANQDEWRDALLSLLRTLPGSSNRTPDTLVAAGIIPLFVDVLNLRTEKARRVYSRTMEFLDTFVHAVRDALATLTAAKGFDAISDLIEYETKSSYENVSKGLGIPDHHKTPSMDYQIPYFQQQTLRWMFRFVNHIMQHGGGGFDRVLRNLIDSPQLLTSLRLVLENARVFGSHVWSNAVNILSSFIHNEPTSYAVIAEAGLSKSLLQAVTQSEIRTQEKFTAEEVETEGAELRGEAPPEPSTVDTAKPEEADQKPRECPLVRPRGMRLASGVMTAPEALSCIPSAFGAICLNASGLQLFQSSHALESFFEIFENPEHVKCLKDDPHLVRSLGTTFDELVRHHPALKTSVMSSVIVMVARVALLCRSKAWSLGMGTKLWSEDSQGKPSISGDLSVLFREIGAPFDETSEDGARCLGVPELNANTLPNGSKLTIGDLSQVVPSSSDSFEPKDQDEIGLTATDYLFPVMRFLGAFFENQSNCMYFIESGGVEFVLDFATLQSLPFDFHHTDTNQELTVLVHMLVETKPHLVIPSLINRAQTAVDSLTDFWSEPQDTGFFTSLIKPAQEQKSEEKGKDVLSPLKDKGTYYAKHMSAALVLTDLLREIFSMPLYQTRPSQQTSAFLQVNLADKYCSLVEAMGRLHAACVWEEILLERNIPDTWDKATKVQNDKSHDGAGTSNTGEGSNQPETGPSNEGQASGSATQASDTQESKEDQPKVPDDGVAVKNVRALRYLLSSLPSSITGFLHNLGIGLIGKKKTDLYQKQNATMVADSISGAVLQQMQFSPPNSTDSPKHRFAYLIVILSSFSHLLLEGKLSCVLRRTVTFLNLE